MDRDLIKKLIEEGLELYGYGRVEEAVKKWKEVLKIDPDNEIVIDYLETAGFDVRKEKEKVKEEVERESILKAIEKEDLEEVFAAIEGKECISIEEFCFNEMVRYALFTRLRRRYLNGDAIPTLKVPPRELVTKKLTPKEGFLLSQMDGNISIRDLSDLCGISEDEIYFVMARFEKEGIIEFR